MTYNLGEKELCLKNSADKQDFLLKNKQVFLASENACHLERFLCQVVTFF
jgi:hypothetical protein